MYKKSVLFICFVSLSLCHASSQRLAHDRFNAGNEADLALMNDPTQPFDDRRLANLRYTLRNYDTIMRRQRTNQRRRTSSSDLSPTPETAYREPDSVALLKKDLIHQISSLQEACNSQRDVGLLYICFTGVSGLAALYLFRQNKSSLLPYAPLAGSLYCAKKAYSSLEGAKNSFQELVDKKQQLALLQSV